MNDGTHLLRVTAVSPEEARDTPDAALMFDLCLLALECVLPPSRWCLLPRSRLLLPGWWFDDTCDTWVTWDAVDI